MIFGAIYCHEIHKKPTLSETCPGFKMGPDMKRDKIAPLVPNISFFDTDLHLVKRSKAPSETFIFQKHSLILRTRC